MLVMMCILVWIVKKRDIHVLVKQDSGIEGKDYFVYKIITCPIRADILDVYSKLEKYITVLADLAAICVKAWYLCKGYFAIRSELS